MNEDQERTHRGTSPGSCKWIFSFRTKLATFVSLLIGMISLFIFFYFPAKLEEQATRAVTAKARSIAQMTAFSLSPALFFEDVESILEVFESAKQNDILFRISVTDTTGRERASFGAKVADEREQHGAAESGQISTDGSAYYLTTPVLHNGHRIGSLSIGLSLEDLKREIGRSRRTIGLVSFVLFLISMITVFGMSTVITKPLRNMAEAVLEISKGEWNRRANVSSRDEVGQLAQSFNAMVESLETAYGKLESANRDLHDHARNLQSEIGERKRAETALRESENRLKTILGCMHAGIVILETETRRIVDANPVAVSMIGAPVEAVVGSPGERFISSNGDGIYPKKAALEGNAAEAIIHRHTGETVPILMTEVSVVLGGKDHILQNFIDLTERKQLEEELAKTEKLESIGILAGGIAHDFNNSLTAILGNITLAKLESVPGEKIHELLSAAEKATRRAKGLTQQLLTFSTGGAPIRKDSSLAELLRETASFILSGSNVKCVLSIPEDLWIVKIDEGQIAQVMNNLLLNAREAMPKGGKIEIRAENLFVDPSGMGGARCVRVRVRDEGIGISQDILQRIFDPYFTTKKKGNGLGLATAYSILKQHKGHIEVDSTVGEGTTFSIYLPASNEQTPSPEAEVQKSSGGGGKILLMDDDESILESVGALLEHFGYEVVLARDGQEVVSLYRNALHTSRPFGAVILDLTIVGGVGGKEAVGKLLEIDPHAKAIVSSGYSSDPVMASFRDYGFAGVVAKPYDIGELDQALQKILKNGHSDSIL